MRYTVAWVAMVSDALLCAFMVHISISCYVVPFVITSYDITLSTIFSQSMSALFSWLLVPLVVWLFPLLSPFLLFFEIM